MLWPARAPPVRARPWDDRGRIARRPRRACALHDAPQSDLGRLGGSADFILRCGRAPVRARTVPFSGCMPRQNLRGPGEFAGKARGCLGRVSPGECIADCVSRSAALEARTHARTGRHATLRGGFVMTADERGADALRMLARLHCALIGTCPRVTSDSLSAVSAHEDGDCMCFGDCVYFVFRRVYVFRRPRGRRTRRRGRRRRAWSSGDAEARHTRAFSRAS
jgi:hypothetical protein